MKILPKLTSPIAYKIGLIVLSGILLILIFPAIDIEWLAWVAFIPLFAAIEEESLKNAFWLGWGTGLVFCLGTMYWVTVAMAEYGGLPEAVSGGLLLLLAVVLSLYFGSFCMIIRYLQQHTVIPVLIGAPVVWVALEYLRTYFIIGFPWNLLGYSQYLTPSVIQIADITGVYGVSFVIVLINAGIYTCIFTSSPKGGKLKIAIITAGCLGVCILYSLLTLSAMDAVQSEDTEPKKLVDVAVVQGNIDQGVKWDNRHRQAIVDAYIRLSQQTLDEQPALIVWPETAVPFVFNYEPEYRERLVEAIRQFETHLLFGGQDIILTPPPKPYNSYNSAFLLSAEGNVLAKYDKMHLVPFGEYVPFRKLLFFVDKLVEVIGEVVPGKTYTVMTFENTRFSTVICYEIIFPNLVRKFVDRGAQFLVTITNDAWYGRSSAPYQHFAMATFRAVENRVAVVRAANTGISGFIDPGGRIIAQSEIFVEDAFTRAIPLKRTTTFYTRYGDVFAIACLVISALWVGYAWYNTSTRKELWNLRQHMLQKKPLKHLQKK